MKTINPDINQLLYDLYHGDNDAATAIVEMFGDIIDIKNDVG